ncbi:hypothetical protein ABXT44_05410 [Candidatus Pseudothioglobus sp. Uisw_041]|uniref:hypothetical protein n=1 Tax=Candidatus Pseudothioglobus sp. Uisw_041 TaxID=3230996 RepID=UPI003A867A48
MKKLILLSLIVIIVGFYSKDIYLVIKLIMYFAFFWSIIRLGKFLSRDFNDVRDNDYFGE